MADHLDLTAWKTFLGKNKDVKDTGISDKLRVLKQASDDFAKTKTVGNSAEVRKKLQELTAAALAVKLKELKRDPSQVALKTYIDNMTKEASARMKVQLSWEADHGPDQTVARAAQERAQAKDATLLATVKDCETKIGSHVTLMQGLQENVLMETFDTVPDSKGKLYDKPAAPTWKKGFDPSSLIAKIIVSGDALLETAKTVAKKDEKITPSDPYRQKFLERFNTLVQSAKTFQANAHAPQLIYRTCVQLHDECSAGDIREYLNHVKARCGS